MLVWSQLFVCLFLKVQEWKLTLIPSDGQYEKTLGLCQWCTHALQTGHRLELSRSGNEYSWGWRWCVFERRYGAMTFCTRPQMSTKNAVAFYQRMTSREESWFSVWTPTHSESSSAVHPTGNWRKVPKYGVDIECKRGIWLFWKEFTVHVRWFHSSHGNGHEVAGFKDCFKYRNLNKLKI